MKRTTLKLSDFQDQAAAILAASKARRADLRMEKIDGDDTPPDDEIEDDPNDDGDDPDDDADDKDDSDKDDDKKDSDKSAEDDKVDRAEYERVKRHRAAADRRVATLESENTTLKNEVAALKADGKKADNSGPSERETELQNTMVERDRTINDLRIQNAFLAANQFNWHDPADALRLADLRDVEIEEDGTVVGIKEALQKLAREKPHLIKTEDKADPKSKSGSSSNGRRKGETKKPDRAALSKVYPVLGARR